MILLSSQVSELLVDSFISLSIVRKKRQSQMRFFPRFNYRNPIVLSFNSICILSAEGGRDRVFIRTS